MIMFVAVPAAYAIGRAHKKGKSIEPAKIKTMRTEAQRKVIGKLAEKTPSAKKEHRQAMERELAILKYVTEKNVSIEQATAIYEAARSVGRDMNNM